MYLKTIRYKDGEVDSYIGPYYCGNKEVRLEETLRQLFHHLSWHGHFTSITSESVVVEAPNFMARDLVVVTGNAAEMWHMVIFAEIVNTSPTSRKNKGWEKSIEAETLAATRNSHQLEMIGAVVALLLAYEIEISDELVRKICHIGWEKALEAFLLFHEGLCHTLEKAFEIM